MIKGSIYHRPESEYAYLYDANTAHLRIRTEKSDIESIFLLAGDPYNFGTKRWESNEIPLTHLFSTDCHDYWFISLTPEHRRLQYGFHLIDKSGEEIFYGDKGTYPYREEFLKSANLYFKIPYFHEVDRFKILDWIGDTVWYQIFPERFCNGDTANDPKNALPWNSKFPEWDDFFGGDIAGILSKLDYLKELGINGIYLCPIFTSPSNHKYDTLDYYEIDPHFGDKKLFRQFVELAHEKGFKIMLDAVFNHIGDTSPQWQDVLENGENSKFADWFHIQKFPVSYDQTENFEYAENITYDTFAFTPHMPKLNTANKEVQSYLLDIAKYWVKEFDIDAWRLDVANEVDHQLWKLFHKEICDLKDNFYILGEVWNSAQPWLQGDELHGSMNYAYTEIMTQYFAEKVISAEKMMFSLNEQMSMHRKQTNSSMMNMLDSHDTPRILTVCEGNQELMQKMLVFMFLQSGSPCIYYGTEIAMEGGPDPDCRRCMDWEVDFSANDSFKMVQKLIHIRKEYSELLSKGDVRFTLLENDLIQVERSLDEDKIIAFFNHSAKEIPTRSFEIETLIFSDQKSNQQNLSGFGWILGRATNR
ncbi:alpha-glycosidase [Enterococcus gallinarum]|uniref:glycoside hydrolase family 13 protein n=1 Tax=Enterococcus gallinarum TaxID=1353 RepID=UPI001AD75CFA|nr:glycoside hydrolase family 13 protein [Enterococcus gallinarum]MBO6327438.1 alpha-glycosidase [Enterococcus gallinarum]MDV7787690.1 glycoside hydrolase family 13 protein [Enterococcus gallinarum]